MTAIGSPHHALAMTKEIAAVEEIIADLKECLRDNLCDASLVAMYSADIAEYTSIRSAMLFASIAH